MIFTASVRKNLVFIFGCFVFSFAAIGQPTVSTPEKKAQACVNWLVEGEPYIRTAAAIQAGDAATVTGAEEYPLPYVLTNLGLSKWIPESWNKVSTVLSNRRLILAENLSSSGAVSQMNVELAPKDTPLLSLGEGRSDFIPFVVTNGLKGYGIDVANDIENGKLDSYFGDYFMQSLPGNATDLSAFPDGSQSLVVSHMLLPYLNEEQRIAVIRESFRTLSVGGTARHSILVPDVDAVLGDSKNLLVEYEALLTDSVKHLVRKAVGDAPYNLAVFMDEPRFHANALKLEAVGLPSVFAASQPLRKRALNLLIVLRKPETSSLSWEGWLGI